MILFHIIVIFFQLELLACIKNIIFAGSKVDTVLRQRIEEMMLANGVTKAKFARN